MPTWVSRTSWGSTLPTSTFTLWPLSSWPSRFVSPQFTWDLTLTVTSGGTTMRRWPIPRRRAHRRLAGAEVQPRDVDAEVADADAVVAAKGVGRRWRVLAVADPVTDVRVEAGGD